MPLTGAQIIDSKSITDDICRRRGGVRIPVIVSGDSRGGDSDKSEASKPTCFSAEWLLVDRLVRTIRFSWMKVMTPS